jgi:hypothetical protein
MVQNFEISDLAIAKFEKVKYCIYLLNLTQGFLAYLFIALPYEPQILRFCLQECRLKRSCKGGFKNELFGFFGFCHF